MPARNRNSLTETRPAPATIDWSSSSAAPHGTSNTRAPANGVASSRSRSAPSGPELRDLGGASNSRRAARAAPPVPVAGHPNPQQKNGARQRSAAVRNWRTAEVDGQGTPPWWCSRFLPYASVTAAVPVSGRTGGEAPAGCHGHTAAGEERAVRRRGGATYVPRAPAPQPPPPLSRPPSPVMSSFGWPGPTPSEARDVQPIEGRPRDGKRRNKQKTPRDDRRVHEPNESTPSTMIRPAATSGATLNPTRGATRPIAAAPPPPPPHRRRRRSHRQPPSDQSRRTPGRGVMLGGSERLAEKLTTPRRLR